MSPIGSIVPRTSSSCGPDLSFANNLSSQISKKRKRSVPDHGEAFSKITVSVSASSNDDDVQASKSTQKRQRIAEVPMTAIHPPPLAFPKSLYHGHLPSMPPCCEKTVLREIQIGEENQTDKINASDEDSFADAELESFVIYRQHKFNVQNGQKRENPRANELASLHEINERGVRLYFDGVIWHNGTKRHLQRIPFETLSIGGYGEMDRPAVECDIWIQSFEGKKYSTWYRLRQPAEEYRRFHEPFLWMAELAKHVVNFLSTHYAVCLDRFRNDFYNWLTHTYRSDNLLIRWLKSYGRQDFRHVLASQPNFLWCQASQVDTNLETHPVWTEIHPVFLSAIPEQVERETRADMFVLSKEANETIRRRKTTVTAYVYTHFKPLQKFLYCQEPTVRLLKHHDLVAHRSPGVEIPAIRITTQSKIDTPDASTSIAVGDVVSIPQDTMTAWKSDDKDWYGYVQSITETIKGCQLGLLWLYRPSDTQCLKVSYPFVKELFLSDHCNCGDSPIYAKEVVHRPRVAFFGDPAATGIDFFVRQRYIEGDGAWQTLQASDFSCNCSAEKHDICYVEKDTLLVRIRKVLEPVVLVQNRADGGADRIKVRRLLRRLRDYGDITAEPNELVLTERFEIVSKADVDRECHVRAYSEEDRRQGKVPPPYNRQGTADHYFITSQDFLGDEAGLQPLAATSLAYFKEGWDPSSRSCQPLLNGLDLFAGGGNLGRGLEEGGAVHFGHVVDLYNEALHTYRANLKVKDDAKLFRGSVNDYLTQAMQGKGGPFVAQRGEVDIIAAGSPCQGFSLANPFRGNDAALLNCSLVASVVAFIDFYRPKYALMENVIGMARGPDTENMLALIMSALVGLGYQARTFGLDAWNFGSPQSRSRVFISIAAPGMTPMAEPPHTHSHPESVVSNSLARLANGLRASPRYTMQTPFHYISPAEATKDLPATDARTSCIPFPDHRMSRTLSILARVQIGSIPRFPGGCSFVTAASRGYMPKPQTAAFNWDNQIRAGKNATCWQRVKRNALMPTVLTAPRPDDGINGVCLHWDQERLLTVMEVRRAQGFVDEDVLIGTPSHQWKIIGNSVARPVALALGMCLRKAWLAHSVESRHNHANQVSQHNALRSQLVKIRIIDSKTAKPGAGKERGPKQIDFDVTGVIHNAGKIDADSNPGQTPCRDGSNTRIIQRTIISKVIVATKVLSEPTKPFSGC